MNRGRAGTARSSTASRAFTTCATLATILATVAAQERASTDTASPANWSTLNPQARLIALRAARTDARLRIAEQIQSIELVPGLHVRDLAVESDMLTAALHEPLRGAETTRETLRDDLLLAEATLRLPAAGVRSCLKAAVSFAQSPRFTPDDLRQKLDTLPLAGLEADGIAAPPWPYIREAGDGSVDEMPQWACGTIEAFASCDVRTGDAAPPEVADGSSGEQRAEATPLAAAIRAEAAARERLIEVMTALEPSPNADRAQLAAAVAEARVTHTRVRSDQVEVTVQISGARLWKMVRSANVTTGTTPATSP